MFATMLLLDDQVTGRSVTTVPLISVTRAVRMRVSPTRRLELTGSMTTLATIAAGTGTTLTAAVPDFPTWRAHAKVLALLLAAEASGLLHRAVFRDAKSIRRECWVLTSAGRARIDACANL